MDEKHIRQRSVLARTISNESFIEKLLLLLLTALISGLLIPYMSTEIQRGNAHNDMVSQAQGKLYEDVARTLITYETLLLDVTWFKTEAGYNDSMGARAFQRYQDRAPDLLADWRVESIKSRQLVSADFGRQLDSFQVMMFRMQDGPVTSMYRKNASMKDWLDQHIVNEKMLGEARELISLLARQLKLSKADGGAMLEKR